MKRFLFLTIAIALILSLITSCSNGKGTGVQNSSASKQSTIQKLMGLMPASVMKDDYATVIVNDYAKMYRVTGIPRPASSGDKDVDDYIMAWSKVFPNIMPRGGFISGIDQSAKVGPIRSENVGFGYPDVDGDIYAMLGPIKFEVLSGSFSPASTKEAFTKQNGWPEWAKNNFSSEVYKNVVIHSWGDVYKEGILVPHLDTRLMPPHIDSAGRAYPLAVTQSNVFYSNNMSDVKMMVDLLSDKTLSLTNLPQYAAIADGLTELNVYTASIARDITANSTDLKDAGQLSLLHKYIAYARGNGKRREGILQCPCPCS